MLASDLSVLMALHSADIVGPAMELSSGISIARRNRLDVALLDISLGEKLVWPLARKLREQTVPFVFTSAECTQDMLPAEFSNATCLEKPARNCEIVETVAGLVASPC